MIRPSIVKFVDKFQEETYLKLSKDSPIRKGVDKAIRNIKLNAFYGEPIPKKLIPKEYLRKYNITNLWWVALTKEARLVYSITTPDQVEIVSLVIELFGKHKEYERRFKY